MQIKAIVSHPGKQHSFRVATALKKHDMLFSYITTIYDKKGSFIMKLIKHFLSQENLDRANSRKTEKIKDSDVVLFNQIRGLIEIALARYDSGRKLYNLWQHLNSKSFGKKVAKYAIKNQADIVIAYDTNALDCFQYLIKHNSNIVRVMDVSAANRIYMKNIYENDFAKAPLFSKKLKEERRILWNTKNIQRLQQELESTQFFLVPSNFVKESLEYSGISPNQILMCPYGANFTVDSSNKKFNFSNRLEVVYVGNITEMKGIYYLLEAAKSLDSERFHFTVVGKYDNTDHIFDKYMDTVTFTGRVSHERVKEILSNSDVFVFTSLGEGLSLSVLEALSCGLPCIVTKNSGANDAIVDYKNGFVIDIQRTDEIQDRLIWIDAHRELLPEMSINAKKAAQQYSWSNHEDKLIEAISSIILTKNV